MPAANPLTIEAPTSAPYDARVTIRLTGCLPDAPVKLSAALDDDAGQRWQSWGIFYPDADGRIDLSSQPPVDGSYQIACPMGMIWSMRPADPQARGWRFIQRQTTPLHVTLRAVQGERLAVHIMERLRLADGVRQVSLAEDGLHGLLFLPGEQPRAVVLVLTGSGGGIDATTAALLARHGYAALALAYFAFADLPAALNHIPLEYFERGIAWLHRQHGLTSLPVVVCGKSRGGELALLLGATFPALIDSVIAYAPSSHLWGGFGGDSPVGWTHKGGALPFVQAEDSPAFTQLKADCAAQGLPLPLTPRFQHAISTPDAASAIIPVERIRGSVLLIAGGDDQMWPSAAFSEQIIARMRASGRSEVTYRLYPEAGHQISAPFLPATITDVLHPVDQTFYAYGGHTQAYAEANEQSWRCVLQFLNERIMQRP